MRHLLCIFGLGLFGCEATLLGSQLPGDGLVGEPPAPPDDPVDDPEPDQGPIITPLRRLTALEYTRSLGRLFPGVTLPAVSIPPDAKPFGFDNDAEANQPSASLVDAYVEAAQVVAAQASATGSPVYVCATRDAACRDRIIQTVGRRAYRRPLTADEVAGLARFYTQGPAANDFRAATQLMLEALLQAPDFLYRFDAPAAGASGALQALDDYSVATRLAFLVTAASPDDLLLDAARDGRLATPDGLAAEFDRLAAQPDARAGLLHFFHQWFEAEKVQTVRKLEADGLDDALRDDLVEELDRVVSSLLFDGEGGTLDELFSRPATFVSPRTAPLYGLTPPASGWARVSLDPTKRAGVLTQPLFLATHAHPGNPSPVLRGVFILEKLLCVRVPPPPAAAQGIAITAGGTPGPTTNRMRYTATTAQPGTSCANCHEQSINPPGFAFENFDTMGRRIETEAGLTIDASGQALGLTFGNGLELSALLGKEPRVSRCLTERFARFAMGGEEWLRDPATLTSLNTSFGTQQRNLKAFVRSVVTHPSFRVARFATP